MDIKEYIETLEQKQKEYYKKQKIANRQIKRLSEVIKQTGENDKISTKKFLNNDELSIKDILDKIINKDNFYYSPQTPLASFLNSKQWNSYYTLYVDFLILDNNHYPKLVIEYFGNGHYGEDNDELTKMRIENNDKIKEIIFKKAGILLVIITNKDIEKLEAWYCNVAEKIANIANEENREVIDIEKLFNAENIKNIKNNYEWYINKHKDKEFQPEKDYPTLWRFGIL